MGRGCPAKGGKIYHKSHRSIVHPETLTPRGIKPHERRCCLHTGTISHCVHDEELDQRSDCVYAAEIYDCRTSRCWASRCPKCIIFPFEWRSQTTCLKEQAKLKVRRSAPTGHRRRIKLRGPERLPRPTQFKQTSPHTNNHIAQYHPKPLHAIHQLRPSALNDKYSSSCMPALLVSLEGMKNGAGFE